jgi:hypothetical protein
MEIKTLTGKRIHLLKGDSAIIELNNSLFNDGGQLVGSYSFPVKLALNNETLEAIDYAPDLEKKVRNPLIPVIVKLGNQTFKKAVLSVSVDGQQAEGNLQLDLRIINETLKNTKLTEIPDQYYFLGSNEDNLVLLMKQSAINTDWRVYPYAFLPIRNLNYGGEITQTFTGALRTEVSPTVNEVNISGASDFLFVKTRNATTSVGPRIVFKVPFFYLCYVIKKIGDYLGYKVTGDFIADPEVNKILIENINNANFYTGYGFQIAMYEHLPVISIEDFFKALVSFFNIRISLNQSTSELSFSWKKEALKKRKIVDLREFPYKILKQEFSEERGYTISAEADKFSTDLNEITDQYIYKDGFKKIDIKAGTLRTTTDIITGEDIRILESQKQGNIYTHDNFANDVDNSGIKEFPLRFVFNRGLKPNSLGRNLPSGDIEGDVFSLLIAGNNSLFSYAHQAWLNAVNSSKTARISVLLPATTINKLEDDSVILLNTESGASVYCLWEKVKFAEQKDNSNVLAEFDLLLLDSVKPTNPEDEAGIFARLRLKNKTYKSFATENGYYADFEFQLWANRACTIPYTGSVVLYFLRTISQREIDKPGTVDQTINTYTFKKYEKFIVTGPLFNYVFPFNLGPANSNRYDVTLLPISTRTQEVKIKIDLQLIATPQYKVLPTIEP